MFHHQAEKQPSRPKEYIRYIEGFPPALTETRRQRRGKGCPAQEDARHSANSATLLTWLLLGYENVQATSIHMYSLQLCFFIYLINQPTFSVLHTSRLNSCKHFTGWDKNIQGKSRLTETLTAASHKSNSIFFI